MAEVEEEERERLAALDEIISPTRPVISNLGGAHFSIRFPINMRMARVYSMDGSKMLERYFKNIDRINLDLSSLPTGFYAVLALGEDGRVYGLKLYR